MQKPGKPTRTLPHQGLRPTRGPILGVGLLIALILAASPVRPLLGSEILSDSFESGDLTAWSASAAGDCEIVQSEVPNCDFDTELGSWSLSDPGNVYFISDDDSDGDPSSGAVEMVAAPGGTSMSLCVPDLVASGTDSVTSMLEVKLVSGTVDHCRLHLAAHSGTDCTGTGGSIWGSVSVEASWRTRRPGFVSAGNGIRSLLLRLSCTGEDAVVRFDDVVVTALSVNLP